VPGSVTRVTSGRGTVELHVALHRPGVGPRVRAPAGRRSDVRDALIAGGRTVGTPGSSRTPAIACPLWSTRLRNERGRSTARADQGGCRTQACQYGPAGRSRERGSVRSGRFAVARAPMHARRGPRRTRRASQPTRGTPRARGGRSPGASRDRCPARGSRAARLHRCGAASPCAHPLRDGIELLEQRRAMRLRIERGHRGRNAAALLRRLIGVHRGDTPSEEREPRIGHGSAPGRYIASLQLLERQDDITLGDLGDPRRDRGRRDGHRPDCGR
jgi:hypothetical protein